MSGFDGGLRPLGIGAGALALGLALSACNGPAGSVSPGSDSVGTRIGNLLAFNSTTAPPMPNKTVNAAAHIDCPIIQIDPGASAFRVAAGEGSAGVKYQIAIGDVARECALNGGKLAIRVGVETNVVLGPSGAPGSYSAPLRIAVRRTSDETILASKTYRVGGNVGASGPAQYSLIADPLEVPYINEHAADDYEIVMGLGENGGPNFSAGKKKRGG